MSYASEKVRVLVVQWCPTLCDPMAVAHQAPLSMELSRQEHWSGFALPSPGDFSDPGIEAIYNYKIYIYIYIYNII